MEQPFNPLDKGHLGESVANALLNQPELPMADMKPFDGAGIYAIYYHGEFPGYREVSGSEKPIYVGEAMPPGARKGKVGLGLPTGLVLHRRLRKHAKSIMQATNLKLDDFTFRFLIVEDIWVPLGETMLIQRFEPLWNREIDGFGNNDPGGGRYGQEQSAWDTIHPGRPWAAKCKPNRNAGALLRRWCPALPPRVS